MRRFSLLLVLIGLVIGAAASPAAAQNCIPIQPGMDVAGTVANAPAGSTFCFSAGEYQGVTIQPRNGDRFICESGAVFNGGGRAEGFMRAMIRPNDPNNVTGVTVSGCTVVNYGSPTSVRSRTSPRGAIEGYSGWVIENNVLDNNVLGIGMANVNWGAAYDFVLRGNTVRNSSELSLLVNGAGYTIEGNTFERAGHALDRDSLMWESGIKITCMPYATDGSFTGFIEPQCGRGGAFRGNTVRDNAANGVWFDVFSRGIRVEGNTVTGSGWSGIMCEICYDFQIVGNNVSNNGRANFSEWLWRGGEILLANASGAVVSGNRITVVQGARGIIFVDEASRTPRGTGVQIVDNTVIYETAPGYSGFDPIYGFSGASAPLPSLSGAWDRNTYCVSDAGAPYWYLNGGKGFAEWQAQGHDGSGRALPFSDPACGGSGASAPAVVNAAGEPAPSAPPTEAPAAPVVDAAAAPAAPAGSAGGLTVALNWCTIEANHPTTPNTNIISLNISGYDGGVSRYSLTSDQFGETFANPGEFFFPGSNANPALTNLVVKAYDASNNVVAQGTLASPRACDVHQ